MNIKFEKLQLGRVLSVFSFYFVVVNSVMAETAVIDNVTITQVHVNGAADTKNPGTTCINISAVLPGICTGAFIAIPNNNSELISAALTAKVSSSNTRVYYDDTGSYHCPGAVFTPCSVISIAIK
jgi:hypothetical protein